MFDYLKRRHRDAVRGRPFPESFRPLVARAVHLYERLSDGDRGELEGLIQVFLDEKHFEGAGGLVVTDEIRVTIAAQACLLLLHRETDIYPDLETVLVYPHTYVAKVSRHEGPVVVEGPSARLGESWQRGLVIVSWDEVEREVRGLQPGKNVVLHEFAHQLDSEDGSMDGAPDLRSRARYVSWAQVLGEEYKALGERLARGLASDIDAYGATSPPEFFAVVTEHFFERPEQLHARHPALYAELAAFYGLDPARLVATTANEPER